MKFRHSKVLEKKLHTILRGLPVESIHISLMDILGKIPLYVGSQDTKKVYPASIYKLYIAGALLDGVYKGEFSLDEKIVIRQRNATDKKKEISSDKRPLLKARQIVSLEYLLDLMITRSDNTAANTLIDVLGRARINKFIHSYGWLGSEVTRKFLPRVKEEKRYQKVYVTMTATRHISEFLYLVEMGKLIHPEWSAYLKELLGRQLDKTKVRRGLSREAQFYHKTGWFEYVEEGRKKGVCGDCGIIEWKNKKYIVSCIVEIPEPRGRMILQKIGKKIV